MAVKSLEEYEKELKKSYAPQEAEAIAANEQKYKTEKKLTTDTYNRQIDETSKAYEDLYDENAVQRLINEREVAENMANSGLTDSGLNRTQQTAVQLSYANNKNRIDVTRRKAIDSLTASLANAITKLDIEQNENAAAIKSNYAALASSGAKDMYNNALQEETKRIKDENDYKINTAKLKIDGFNAETNRMKVENENKINAAKVQVDGLNAETNRMKVENNNNSKQQKAEKEASYIIKTNGGLLRRNYTGSLKANGVDVIYNSNNTTTYIDNNSGKKTTIPIWKNPYTNSPMHNDLKDKNGNYDSSKAFDNGYQPNNINGYKLKKYDTTTVRGRTQTVFTLVKGHNTEKYIWDGESNKYVRVALNKEGYWVII